MSSWPRWPAFWPVLWILSLAPAPGAAHPAGTAAAAGPLDPRAEVPPATAPTALRRFRAATPPEPVGWREANERVERIGGWKAYLREAQQPEPAASAPAPDASPAPSREQRHGRP